MKLAAILRRNAALPDRTRYGTSGIAAPSVNATNEPKPAASGAADGTLVQPDLLEDEQTRRLFRPFEDTVDEVSCLVRLEAAPDVDVGQDPALLFGRLAQLEALELELVLEELALRLDRDILTDAHAECAGEEPSHAGQDDDPGRGPAPATPITRARLLTSPSLAPNTIGRRTAFARVSWLLVGSGRRRDLSAGSRRRRSRFKRNSASDEARFTTLPRIVRAVRSSSGRAPRGERERDLLGAGVDRRPVADVALGEGILAGGHQRDESLGVADRLGPGRRARASPRRARHSLVRSPTQALKLAPQALARTALASDERHPWPGLPHDGRAVVHIARRGDGGTDTRLDRPHDLDDALAIGDERLHSIASSDLRRRLCRRSVHEDVTTVAQPGRERAGLHEAHRAQPAIDSRLVGGERISHAS